MSTWFREEEFFPKTLPRLFGSRADPGVAVPPNPGDDRATMLRQPLVVACTLLFAACRHDAGQLAPNPTGTGTSVAAPTSEVWLRGDFVRVVKGVTGTAEIRHEADQYWLVLRDVTTDAEGQIHVYLVGHDAARTTRAVTEADLKYDMAPLERGVLEQRILLPSRPDDSLRSVVLFEVEFGVNLAVAALRAPFEPR